MRRFTFNYMGVRGTELFHAAQKDQNTYTVCWYTNDGHVESGSTEYHATSVEGFLKDGLWEIQDEVLEPEVAHVEILGIHRPELTTRKVGKVQMHMVDQGFPNALTAIAQVMTWAADVKGYKLHDWKNLPDAENALEGAASRHRVLHNTQRQAGAELVNCTDHESELLHKAHEAFNVLAELELIITKKIV